MSKSIGENIRYYRKLKGMKQKQLAEKSNLSERSIISYENGIRFPKIEQLISISKSLEIPIDKLNPDIDLPNVQVVEKPLSKYSTKELLQELLRRENEDID